MCGAHDHDDVVQGIRDGLADCPDCENQTYPADEDCPTCGRSPPDDKNAEDAAAPSTLRMTADAIEECFDDLRAPGFDPECEAAGPDGLCCTRPTGHAGPHVAHVEDEPVALWVSVARSYALRRGTR